MRHAGCGDSTFQSIYLCMRSNEFASRTYAMLWRVYSILDTWGSVGYVSRNFCIDWLRHCVCVVRVRSVPSGRVCSWPSEAKDYLILYGVQPTGGAIRGCEAQACAKRPSRPPTADKYGWDGKQRFKAVPHMQPLLRQNGLGLGVNIRACLSRWTRLPEGRLRQPAAASARG